MSKYFILTYYNIIYQKYKIFYKNMMPGIRTSAIKNLQIGGIDNFEIL